MTTAKEYRRLRAAVQRGAVTQPRKVSVTVRADAKTMVAVDKLLARVNPVRGGPLGEVYCRSDFVRAAVLALLADAPDDVRYWLEKAS